MAVYQVVPIYTVASITSHGDEFYVALHRWMSCRTAHIHIIKCASGFSSSDHQSWCCTSNRPRCECQSTVGWDSNQEASSNFCSYRHMTWKWKDFCLAYFQLAGCIHAVCTMGVFIIHYELSSCEQSAISFTEWQLYFIETPVDSFHLHLCLQWYPTVLGLHLTRGLTRVTVESIKLTCRVALITQWTTGTKAVSAAIPRKLLPSIWYWYWSNPTIQLSKY